MAVFMEYLRKKLGWCPNADAIKPVRRTSTEAGYESTWKGRSPGPDPAPEPTGTAGGDRSGYQENMLLILLALAWLFPVVYQREFLPILVVLSAVAMYYDAQSIRAGSNFEKETLLGDIVTWQPITWGAATLVGGSSSWQSICSTGERSTAQTGERVHGRREEFSNHPGTADQLTLLFARQK